jgi:hypothetical protein
MSAFEGKADIPDPLSQCLLMTQSGQSGRPQLAFTSSLLGESVQPIDHEVLSGEAAFKN